MERVLRLPLPLDAGGSDARGGHLLRGRRALAARLRAPRGPVPRDGSAHTPALPMRPGSRFPRRQQPADYHRVRGAGAGGMRGCDQHLQLHGRDQRHNRGLLVRSARAPDAGEPAPEAGERRGVHRPQPPERGGAGAAGVLLLQLPPAREGAVLRGRRGQRGHRVHPALRARDAHCAHAGRELAGAAAGVRGGRVPDHSAPHTPSREPGTGAPQARLSADGERVGPEPPARVGDIYAAAAGGVARLHLPLSAARRA